MPTDKKTIFDEEHPPFEHWKDRATWALLRSAGLDNKAAGYVMWNETCYPMDPELSFSQANEWLEKNGYLTPSTKPTKEKKHASKETRP